MKTKLAIFVTLGVFLYITLSRFNWRENDTLEWDKTGYYVYLPGLFLYDDLREMKFYPEMVNKYKMTGDVAWYGLHKAEKTGFRTNKYPIGVALLEAPFFFLAHWATKMTKQYPADGFSAYYRLSICLTTILCAVLGLWAQRNFLRRHFNDGVVASTLLLIALGTNLFSYTVYDAGMSHAFSFMLFSVFVNLTDLWYRKHNNISLYLLGLVLGLIVIVRPTNILIILVALLWTAQSAESFKRETALLAKRGGNLLLAAACFVAVVMIQLSYWRYVTGDWVHYSYQEEGFNFLKPEIWNGLFSYRKGWFIYTPLAFISILGFIVLWRKHRQFFVPLTIFMLLQIYVVFSWHQWWYGGSFGCRALIESFAILSVPLAALITWVGTRQLWLKALANGIFACVVSLNIFQSWQAVEKIIPWDMNTKDYYWKSFGKTQRNEEDWNTLEF